MLFNWKLFPGTNLQDLNLDWIINFVKKIPSRLPKFSDHHTWLVYDYSTGEYYDSGEPTGGAGEPGEPGKSPIIGTNGNWYVYNNDVGGYVDTGTRAQGVQGEPGAGVATGGVTGDVLVKASNTDYDTMFTRIPGCFDQIANVFTTPNAPRTIYANEFLFWQGALYQAKDVITSGVAFDASENGNLTSVKIATGFVYLRVFVSIPITAIAQKSTKEGSVTIQNPGAGYTLLAAIPQYTNNALPIVSCWTGSTFDVHAVVYNPGDSAVDSTATVMLLFAHGLTTRIDS